MAKLGKILLVEDDAFDAEMTIRTLRQIPLANEIVWLKTGQHFLDYLHENGPMDITLVILDLNMPKVSGIEALEQIEGKEDLYFPIVILSSSRQNPEIKRCYELGVNAVVTKPVRQQEFVDAVNTLGLFWGVLNNIPDTSKDE